MEAGWRLGGGVGGGWGEAGQSDSSGWSCSPGLQRRTSARAAVS